VDVDVGEGRLEARPLLLFRRRCDRWQGVSLVLPCVLVGVVVGEGGEGWRRKGERVKKLSDAATASSAGSSSCSACMRPS